VTYSFLHLQNQSYTTHAVSMLIEATLNISKIEETAENRAVKFKELSLELISIWDYIASIIRPIVQIFCEVLPPTQAKHMWSLVLVLRAT
jgi:hypothetical protein